MLDNMFKPLPMFTLGICLGILLMIPPFIQKSKLSSTTEYVLREEVILTKDKLLSSVYRNFELCVSKNEHEGLAKNDQDITLQARQKCLFDMINIYGVELTHDSINVNDVVGDFND